MKIRKCCCNWFIHCAFVCIGMSGIWNNAWAAETHACKNPAIINDIDKNTRPGIIVFFKDGTDAEQESRKLSAKYAFKVKTVFLGLIGFLSETMTEDIVQRMRCEPTVSSVARDYVSEPEPQLSVRHSNTREDVIVAVRRIFSDGKETTVLEILDQYGVEPHEQEKERVQLAIVVLSKGNEDKLHYFVQTAKADYRDVLRRYDTERIEEMQQEHERATRLLEEQLKK